MAYSQEERERIMLAVCERVEAGQDFNSACKIIGVPESTVRYWADSDPDFSAMHARARGVLIDRHVNDILVIADTCEDASKARVQVDARKWILARLMPKKFGDKIQAEHTGQDGGPMQFSVVTGVERKDD